MYYGTLQSNKNTKLTVDTVRKKMYTKILHFTVCLFVVVNCDVKKTQIPPKLLECLKTRDKTFPFTDEQISSTCLLEFIWFNRKICENISMQTFEWLASLANKTIHAPQPVGHAFGEPVSALRAKSTRMEYRMLTDQQRREFHQAINDLKSDTTVSPNKYDALARHHQSTHTTAHGGVAFAAWHRYYLVLYEFALQEKNPNVMLPYWDSTLDYEMRDPRDSVIWTEEFLGNGHGEVTKGPFGDWPKKILRSLGSGSSLINIRDIENITESSPDQTSFVGQLETNHDKPHDWIGGSMSSIDTAPDDPVFYMHHAFIDCTWEKYRQRAIQKGENPEIYPSVDDTSPHHSDRNMVNLPPLDGQQLTNADGYKNFWTQKYYTCAPSPSCTKLRPDCGSKWLECDIFTERCVSKGSAAARPRITAANIIKVSDFIFQDPSFSRSIFLRTQSGIHGAPSNGNFETRSKSSKLSLEEFFSILKTMTEQKSIIRSGLPGQPGPQAKSVSLESLKIPDAEQSCGGPSIQNTFKMDCSEGTDLWAFIPVKVVYLRHGNIIYPSHPVDSSGRINNSTDVFAIGQPLSFATNIRLELRSKQKTCYFDKSGLMKIKISSYGLNYNGIYEDTAFVDNRRSASTEIAYIGIKRPTSSTSKVFLTATDECEIGCQPMVINRQRKNGHPIYKPIQGAIEVSSKTPLYYGNTHREAEANVWNIDKSSVPYEKDNQIPVVFLCDYRGSNPWS